MTVLVPARNEERSIVACVESILAQDYTNLQVVVVDGESDDATADLVADIRARDPRVELVTVPRGSIPLSLNAGLAAANGRWLVRVDAHSTVPPAYVSRAVARLRDGDWGGVGGRKDGVGRTSAGRAISVAMASRFGVGNSLYHHGTAETEVDHVPFGAYPVDLIHQVGGWDERLSANEDYEFDYRVRQSGRRLLFDPGLAIRWESRQTVADLFRQYVRYGKGKADVASLHPESMRPRHLAPPLFVAYLAGAAVVAPRRPRLAALLLAPYAVALAAASTQAARRLDRPADRVHVPLAFVAMHVGWGSGFLARLPAALRLRADGSGEPR